jgi:hypothetical protein
MMSLFISAEFCTWISTRPKALHKSTCCSSFCSQCCVHGSMFRSSLLLSLNLIHMHFILHPKTFSLRTAYRNIFPLVVFNIIAIFHHLTSLTLSCFNHSHVSPHGPQQPGGLAMGKLRAAGSWRLGRRVSFPAEPASHDQAMSPGLGRTGPIPENDVKMYWHFLVLRF